MSIAEKKNLKVIIISDGTGETATNMARAAVTQFSDREIFFTRYKNVREKEQIDAIFTEATLHHDIVLYTLVTTELRQYIKELSKTEKVRVVDLMGPLLTNFGNIFETEPDYQPGLFHAVDDKYFKKVEAMEFTLNHDDGRNLNTINEADVVLVGISRTSKTPLSIYISMEGLKVVNVPVVLNIPLPEALFQTDQRKIFALTIDPDELMRIRQNRVQKLGLNMGGEYADMQKVTEEIEWANKLYENNKRWPIFDVTGKAIEEVAAEILKMINMRSQNRFKHVNRFAKKKEAKVDTDE